MIRLNLVLMFTILLSALYLVNVQYESRRLFTELDRARSEAHRLEVEHELLQVQKRAQATPARVELLAKEKLQMRQVTPGITSYVTYTAPDHQDAVASAGSANAHHGVSP